MTIYAGLDVSDKTTHICAVDSDGRVKWRDVCATDPEVLARTLARTLARRCPDLSRVVSLPKTSFRRRARISAVKAAENGARRDAAVAFAAPRPGAVLQARPCASVAPGSLIRSILQQRAA